MSRLSASFQAFSFRFAAVSTTQRAPWQLGLHKTVGAELGGGHGDLQPFQSGANGCIALRLFSRPTAVRDKLNPAPFSLGSLAESPTTSS